MSDLARKVVLPQFVLSEVTDADDPLGLKIALVPGKDYYVRLKMVPGESSRRDGKARWMPSQFNQFPVVLDGYAAPWAEANLWILATLESSPSPNMATASSRAEDMAAYRRFVEEYSIDWLSFPSHKLHRPTYRFNGHLKTLIQNQEIAASTAKRRMATVIRFYRWLVEEKVLTPEHPAWKESDRYIEFKGNYGFSQTKKVTTTDVSIRVSQQIDPYDGAIDDGGKLRPLPQIEQEWLLDALDALGNTEMTLIHLFGLVTGARIQSILTFRVCDVLKSYSGKSSTVLRYPIGPGTGIDTKYNKKLVLHIPGWFHEILHTYCLSNRAIKRRLRAVGGNTEKQYLFLSIRGTQFYTSKQDVDQSESTGLHHQKVGQGVRQYMTDYIIPFIRKKYDPQFHYQFHDTRATFGMNLVDEKLKHVEAAKTTLKEVMSFVQTRMGHASLITTERYLNYRSRLKLVDAVQDGWETKLEQMARRAIDGKNE